MITNFRMGTLGQVMPKDQFRRSSMTVLVKCDSAGMYFACPYALCGPCTSGTLCKCNYLSKST